MEYINSWGGQLRHFRFTAGFHSCGALSTALSHKGYNISQNTLNRYETDPGRIPKKRERHLILLQILAENNGITTLTEASSWLRKAGQPLLMAEEIDEIFCATPLNREAEILLIGDFDKFTDEEKKIKLNALAGILEIDPSSIILRYAKRGSIKLGIAMPSKAVERLRDLVLRKDQALAQLGLLEIVIDNQTIPYQPKIVEESVPSNLDTYSSDGERETSKPLLSLYTEQEWVEFYNNEGQRVFKFLIDKLGNTQDAEDCLQESFLRLFEVSSEKIKNFSLNQAYLLKLSINILLRHNRGKVAGLRAGVSNFYFEDFRSERIVDLNQNLKVSQFDENIDLHQSIDNIIAIAELNKIQSKILRFMVLESLDLNEIANLLKMNPKGIRIHVARMRKKVRSRLNREDIVQYFSHT